MINIFDSVLIVDSIFAEGESFVITADGDASFQAVTASSLVIEGGGSLTASYGGLGITPDGGTLFLLGNLYVENINASSISADSGSIYTDGSGDLVVGGVISVGSQIYGTYWDINGAGAVSFDSGAITSDGSGNLTLNGGIVAAGSFSFMAGQSTVDSFGRYCNSNSGPNAGFLVTSGDQFWGALAVCDGTGYWGGNCFTFIDLNNGYRFDFGSGGMAIAEGQLILGLDGSASFLNSQFNITTDGYAAVLGNGMDIVISSTNILSQQSGGWSLGYDGSASFGGNNAGFTSSGDLYLNNIYVSGAPTATGYLIIQDNEGNPYKVLVSTP